MGIPAIQTRQKNNVLFPVSPAALLGAGASIGFGPAEIDGFSVISVIALSDQPFSMVFLESNFPGGPYVLTQAFTSVSSSGVQSGPFPNVPAGPGFMIAQRFFVTASYLKMTLQNLAAVEETVLEFLVQGNPAP